MTEDQLPRDLIFPLMSEIDAASELLGRGIELLLQLGAQVHEPSSMFATLATGSEKLLKLDIGLLSFEETQQWPSVGVMRNQFGHNIAAMHAQTLADIRRRLGSPDTHGTAPGLVRTLLEEVENDQHLLRVMGCLSDYAISGRFHNLDTLAGNEPPRPSPYELWDAVENDVLRAEPALMAALGTGEYDTIGRPGLNEVLARSIARWWNLHDRAWRTLVYGRQAQMWSAQLGLGIPKDLVDQQRPGRR